MKPECHEGTEETEKGKQRPNESPIVIERHAPGQPTGWPGVTLLYIYRFKIIVYTRYNFRKCIIFCLLKASA